MARTDGNGITRHQCLKAQGYAALAAVLVIAGVYACKSKKGCNCEEKCGAKIEEKMSTVGEFDTGWQPKVFTLPDGRQVQGFERSVGESKNVKAGDCHQHGHYHHHHHHECDR